MTESMEDDFQQDLDKSLLTAKIVPPIGLILNIVFLFVIVRVKSMRTIINVYLTNLAVADSIFLIIRLAFSSIPLDNERDIAIVIIFTSLNATGRYASFCFVTAIAVERFAGVHHPITFRSSASKTRAAKISAGLWVLSLFWGVITSLLENNFASAYNPVNYLIYYILSLIFYVSTFAVTVSMYTYILIKLHRQTTASEQHQKTFGKVARMLVINTAVFCLLNLVRITWTILLIIRNVQESRLKSAVKLTLCAAILDLINSSINTLVYSTTNSNYRAAVVEAFSFLKLARCCSKRKTHKRPKVVVFEKRKLTATRPKDERELSAIGPKDAAQDVGQEQIELSAIRPKDAAQDLAQERIELSAIGPKDAAQDLVQEQIELSAIGPKDAAQDLVQDHIELPAVGPKDEAQELVQEQIELSSTGLREGGNVLLVE